MECSGSVGRALDLGLKCYVLEQDTLSAAEVLVQARKTCSHMSEKLLTGT